VRPTTSRRLRRLAPLFCAGSALGGAPAAAAADSPCSSAAGEPNTMTAGAVRGDTQCLLNRERAEHGLGALTLDRQLSRAALGHSRDMVAKGYFEHDSLSGQSFTGRIADTGWMQGRRRWTVGENIGWGVGRRSIPRAILKSWMNSPPHRSNILHGGYETIGIGIKRGAPTLPPRNGITYTTDFGG
jgi:uncharacterized protein YkwD